MNGPVRVVVATTEGPSTVVRVTAEDPSLRCVVCLGRSTTTLPVSGAYDAFVRSPTGVVERAVGHRAFRVDVSAPIDEGDSWQLGLYLAHRLKAAGRLAEDDTPAGLVLWASGRVDADLTVQPVERLDEKQRRSAELFATPGARILVVVPVAQAEALTDLPATVESMAIGAVGPILRHLDLAPPLVWRRRRRLAWPWRAAALAVLLATGFAMLPRPVDEPPPSVAVTAAEAERLRIRPLDPVYPVVHFDSLTVAIRDADRIRHAGAHVALGIAADGRRDVLGAWVEGEGREDFWRGVVEDLRRRGLEDALVVLSDAGHDGFAGAVAAALPDAVALTGVVAAIRESTAALPARDRRAASAALKTVYQAGSRADAAAARTAFEATWGSRYPDALRPWSADRETLDRLLSVPPVLRALATATSALDELNRSLRRAVDGRDGFPDDATAVAALLAAADGSGVDGRRIAGWNSVAAALRGRYGDRLPPAPP